MTFEEQAAELRRLEAVAVSLGLSDAEFVRIAQDVTAAGSDRMAPGALLTEIRQRIHAAAVRAPSAVSEVSDLAPIG